MLKKNTKVDLLTESQEDAGFKQTPCTVETRLCSVYHVGFIGYGGGGSIYQKFTPEVSLPGLELSVQLFRVNFTTMTLTDLI